MGEPHTYAIFDLPRSNLGIFRVVPFLSSLLQARASKSIGFDSNAWPT